MLITSLIILAPIYFGFSLWDELPDMMPTHWGLNNEPNGYSSKAMAVYGIPLFMLAMQWFMVLVTELDIKKKNHSPKMIHLMLWIIPLMTVLVSVVTYSYSLGIDVNVGFWCVFFLGVLFAVIGNYMPKCRLNWTMGVRNRWTLSDPDTWNHTHRMAGPLWMAGGIITCILAFFCKHIVVACGIFVIFAVMAIAPMVYSYLYYKKNNKLE